MGGAHAGKRENTAMTEPHDHDESKRRPKAPRHRDRIESRPERGPQVRVERHRVAQPVGSEEAPNAVVRVRAKDRARAVRVEPPAPPARIVAPAEPAADLLLDTPADERKLAALEAALASHPALGAVGGTPRRVVQRVASLIEVDQLRWLGLGGGRVRGGFLLFSGDSEAALEALATAACAATAPLPNRLADFAKTLLQRDAERFWEVVARARIAQAVAAAGATALDAARALPPAGRALPRAWGAPGLPWTARWRLARALGKRLPGLDELHTVLDVPASLRETLARAAKQAGAAVPEACDDEAWQCEAAGALRRLLEAKGDMRAADPAVLVQHARELLEAGHPWLGLRAARGAAHLAPSRRATAEFVHHAQAQLLVLPDPIRRFGKGANALDVVRWPGKADRFGVLPVTSLRVAPETAVEDLSLPRSLIAALRRAGCRTALDARLALPERLARRASLRAVGLQQVWNALVDVEAASSAG